MAEQYNNYGTAGAMGPGSSGVVTVGAGPTPQPRPQPSQPGPSPAPTFGLVTALPEEFQAIRTVLTLTEDLTMADDRATYARGQVDSRAPAQPHTVVLTQAGDTGNNSAADACTNLVRSFPSVSFVIMVGTAAGTRVQQVRLGDIVVATWGVVSYDHVYQTPAGPVLRQPFPLPSPFLVRAADLLKAESITGGQPWLRWLDTSPGSLLHPFRPPSGSWPVGLPTVHHGRIGSADRALRDTRVRDAVAARYGLLALEMEGAGIGSSCHLNGPEWLVVRGISDHGEPDADATMRGWRRYAALTAAAYVRALLGRCSPVEPRGGRLYGSTGTPPTWL